MRSRVSTDGGSGPRWNADGAELFYINRRNELVSVSVRRGSPLEFGTPRVVMRVEGNLASSAEVNEDYTFDRRSGRFLMNRANTDRLAVPVKVIVNWKSQLGRR